MLEQLINIIKDVCLKHKLIRTFEYKSSIMVNQQNNSKYFKAIIDDVSLSNLLISTSPNIFTISLDLYILGFVPTTMEDISGNTLSADEINLHIQSVAYDTAIQIIKKLESLEDYQGIIEVHDYSLLTLTRFTDDVTSGVKATIVLNVPIGACDYDDYFNDDEYEDVEDDVEITLTPIELPSNPIKNNCR